MSLKRMRNHIGHTRIKRTCNIINVRTDPYNRMGLVVDFEHSIPANYFERELDIIYAVYLDRVFMKEFLEKSVKIQLPAQDTNFVLEIFAHPHGGFQFIRQRITPGNKIRITFQAKNPIYSDIVKHYTYWDNGTGTLLTGRVGEVDAVTGDVSGSLLKTGSVSQ